MPTVAVAVPRSGRGAQDVSFEMEPGLRGIKVGKEHHLVCSVSICG